MFHILQLLTCQYFFHYVLRILSFEGNFPFENFPQQRPVGKYVDFMRVRAFLKQFRTHVTWGSTELF
jgi:hypothetical protein